MTDAWPNMAAMVFLSCDLMRGKCRALVADGGVDETVAETSVCRSAIISDFIEHH